MSDPWIAEVDAALRRRIADADAQPDFLDVVARARALDPEAFDDEALQQAEALQRAHADAPALDDGPLDAWLDDARLAIDRKVEARRDQPLPPLHRAAPRRAIWWAGGALAAALLLALGIGRLMSTSASDRAEPLDQAELVSEPNDAAGDAVRSSATPRRAHADEPDAAAAPSDATTEAVAPPEPEPGAAEARDDDEAAPADPEAAERSTAPRHPPTRSDRLARLAEQAQEHWRAGRRKEAMELFSEIVDRGGRSRAAEMAFGDLFTLAYQRHDTKAQLSWWRAYLRRFPRGRFADDARAGLCRVGPAADRKACWTRYLDELPRGSYRVEARAAIGDPP